MFAPLINFLDGKKTYGSAALLILLSGAIAYSGDYNLAGLSLGLGVSFIASRLSNAKIEAKVDAIAESQPIVIEVPAQPK